MADGIRERFRSQVRDEAKRVALRQLAGGGPQALSINAIGKELGVSGPALYRYFTSRDDLLGDLIVDAYHDLAVALETAARRARKLAPPRRLRAVAAAYRAWATAEPHRYRLLFAAPLPGYDAQADRFVAASREAMAVLLDVLADTPARPGKPDRLDRQLERWARTRGLTGVSAAVARRAIVVWSRLHGLIGLEIEGNYANMGLDPDLLFDAEVNALL
jgi:AcrR family transcriptional regulator